VLRSMTSKLDPALASFEEAVLGAIGGEARVRDQFFFTLVSCEQTHLPSGASTQLR